MVSLWNDIFLWHKNEKWLWYWGREGGWSRRFADLKDLRSGAASHQLKTENWPLSGWFRSSFHSSLESNFNLWIWPNWRPMKINSWEKIFWGKKWRCWSLFCKLIRGNFHLSQQLQVSTFLLISSAIPSHFPLIMSFAFFTVCIYFNNISNPNSPLSVNSLHISTKSLRAELFLCLSPVSYI